ncbi:MAG: alpha/beta fold hydrolase [Flavobacteriaceae bacterium]|nr:alpha/beta fold hydrolase [Muriicola sp.]MBT8373336.1 alpha/beta fold hydrolase [Deltaproteobacteria bacterium]NNK20783.1 alpha/beta fold hydrolase [Flavobacteriaceae bacterium]NNK35614.1 alpha/beta fold hydrolase [Eudoraea sp.]MBT8290416.1 alpha/beta fold hydrolase [Muriicola sp.]
MPELKSNYKPPLLFRNGHVSTVYYGLFRKIDDFDQERERLELADADFMDLDWSYADKASGKVVILLHGLEGHGQRPYITGSAKHFNLSGYDCCAVNFRGCSGEPNRLYRSYHSGATEDLDAVVKHISEKKKYRELYIKGFSLGGNMVLKYAGEGRELPDFLKAIVAVSAPVDLHSSLRALMRWENIPYASRFRKHLVAKLKAKQPQFPDLLPDHEIQKIKTLKDFDDIYTSRAHGFTDALDYYARCSSLQFLHNIKIRTLIINARNDSFLGPECYPYKEAEANEYVFLEVPEYGGHVGFYDAQNIAYTEKRALKFFEQI